MMTSGISVEEKGNEIVLHIVLSKERSLPGIVKLETLSGVIPVENLCEEPQLIKGSLNGVKGVMVTYRIGNLVDLIKDLRKAADDVEKINQKSKMTNPS